MKEETIKWCGLAIHVKRNKRDLVTKTWVTSGKHSFARSWRKGQATHDALHEFKNALLLCSIDESDRNHAAAEVIVQQMSKAQQSFILSCFRRSGEKTPETPDRQ